MDVRHPLTPHDRAMLELALGHGLPVHVLLTKSDKLGRGAARAALQAVQRDLEGSATVQLFSSLSGEGLAPGSREAGCAARGPGKKKPRLTQRSQPGKTNPVLGDDRVTPNPGR